jgi:hypothetical protein
MLALILERDFIESVEQPKGKFRSSLLESFGASCPINWTGRSA